jgi:hypothetical protein
VTIALSRWCELAQHNNLLSIVHSRHDPCILTLFSNSRLVVQLLLLLLHVCHHVREGARMQGSLGWLLLLDAADRAQSKRPANSVPAPCVVCFLTEAIYQYSPTRCATTVTRYLLRTMYRSNDICVRTSTYDVNLGTQHGAPARCFRFPTEGRFPWFSGAIFR